MDKDQAVDQFLAAIRPAAMRLFEGAEEAARGRLISLLQGEVAPVVRPVTQSVSPSVLGYGALTKRIRDVLVSVALGKPSGVDSEAINAACPDLTPLQVRSALKTLHKTGDAIRVSRGNYIPASSFAKAKTEGVAPSVPDFTLSQGGEVADNDPKGNGAQC